MKKYSWFLMLAFLAFACQLQNEEIRPSDNASGSAIPGAYTINTSSSDGYTWTIVIDQSAAQDISHMNFSGTFCDDAEMTAGNVTAVTVNNQNWMTNLAGSTGVADVCGATKLKLDNFNFNGGVVTIVITFDTKVSAGAFLIKSATNCFGSGNSNYQFSYDCTPVVCYDYQNETAWANGPRYVSRGNWATYTPYQSTSAVNVYAGKSMLAGTATMSAVSGGNVTITITLGAGWSLQEVGEPVKIQGYNSVPAAINPSPGRFAHKGTSLTVTVPAANYYGIHLDVRKQIEVECPNN